MTGMERDTEELLLVEDVLWVLTAPTGKAVYDFPFARLLPCRHPYQPPPKVRAVARVGAFADYGAAYAELATRGIVLLHDPLAHRRSAELPHWYPVLEDLTPKSLWFDAAPDVERIERELGWPIFMKGERQTSRHQKSLAIIEDRAALYRALEAYAEDAILHWQKIVCRQYVPLRPVGESLPDRIPSSFEFRTFWWKGELVGCGRYWWESRAYELSRTEEVAALAVAREAARRIDVPFLVVDIAQDQTGRWLVIECNDGQESGYAGVSPLGLWQRIIELERLYRDGA